MRSFFFLQFIFYCTVAYELPKEFKLCKGDSPNLAGCLKTAVSDAIKFLVPGYPPLGVPPLDPFEIVELTPNASDSINVLPNYKNVKIYGLSNMTITNLNITLPELSLVYDVVNPQLNFVADYSLKGKLLNEDFESGGISNITLLNVKVHHAIKGKKENRNGTVHVSNHNYVVTMVPEKVIFDFYNKKLNTLLNDNWSKIYPEIIKVYEDTLGNEFADLTIRITSSTPYRSIIL